MNGPVQFLRHIVQRGSEVEAACEARLAALPGPRHSLSRLGILYILSLGPLSLSELAEQLCCGRSNMTSSIDRLERDGWVRRSPDPADRRVIAVEITKSGLVAYQNAVAELEVLENELKTQLGPDRVQRIEAAFSEAIVPEQSGE